MNPDIQLAAGLSAIDAACVTDGHRKTKSYFRDDGPGPLIGPLPGTTDWAAARFCSIGASESAAACGLSPYQQPLDIYLRKRGVTDDEADNEAMRMGRAFEPLILDEYQERRLSDIGYLNRCVPTMAYRDKPFITATPDAIAVDAYETFPVDAKSTTFRRAHEFGEEGTDDLPADIVCQAQIQMLVTGAKHQETAVLLDCRTLRIYRVARNDRLLEGMVAAITELWERIQNGDPPEPKWQHPGTPKLVRELYGVSEAETVDLGADALAQWRLSQELGKQITDLEKARDACKSKVLYAMGEAGLGRMPDGALLSRQIVNVKAHERRASSYVKLSERKVKANG